MARKKRHTEVASVLKQVAGECVVSSGVRACACVCVCVGWWWVVGV